MFRQFARALVTWYKRRRRFNEEWNFHLEREEEELGFLGLAPREVRREARWRLGRRSRHKRAALRELDADFRGLLMLIPIARMKRGAALIPSTFAALIVLFVAFDPQRIQLVKTVAAVGLASPLTAERWSPLTPAGVPPVTLAAWCWALLTILGAVCVARQVIQTRHWRRCAYGIVSGALLVLFEIVLWICSLQALLVRSWGADFLQGTVLTLFVTAYALAMPAAVRFWWRDMSNRCPSCLEKLRIPLVSGDPRNVLLETSELETVCLRDHGVMVETRWGSSFKQNGGQIDPL